MKEVEFVRLRSRLCGIGLGKGSRYQFNRIEETIRERIEAGWEYCGYVPVETRGTGDIEALSLIFQRDSRPEGF